MSGGFDLVVIGAGPAGASCARRAGELGLSVVLLEAGTFPRPKPCAGGLTSRAVALAGSGVDAVVRESPGKLRLRLGAATVEWEGVEPVMSTTIRSDLDVFLARSAADAGAVVEFGRRVEAVGEDGDWVTVSTGDATYRGRFVVGADGARSVVADAIGSRRRPDFGAIYVRAFPRDDGNLGAHRGTVTFDPTATSRGYGWIFPKGDHLNVGVFAQRPLHRSSAAALESFLSAVLRLVL